MLDVKGIDMRELVRNEETQPPMVHQFGGDSSRTLRLEPLPLTTVVRGHATTEPSAAVESAHITLLIHVPGPDGRCIGCDGSTALVRARCPRASAAVRVIETYGVTAWDPPPYSASVRAAG